MSTTSITAPTPAHTPTPSYSPLDTPHAPGIDLAQVLGWFSIGLGLAEFLAPRAMAELSGVPHPRLLRAYGLREIACGVGILSSSQPAGWLWARVAGDALDLVTLGAAQAEMGNERRGRNLAATAAVAGVAILDVLGSLQHSTPASLEG